MGLAERRRIAAVAEDLKDGQAKLDQVVGYQLPLECDLSKFPEVPEIIGGYESYKDYVFPMIVRIFTDLCKDALGRQAVKEKIGAVVVENTSISASDGGHKGLSLDGSTLKIQYGFYGYSDKIWDERELLQCIENLL